MEKIVILSGGFDPVHIGHIRMFKEAEKVGHVIVGLNSDEWLIRKKGKNFMSFNDISTLSAGLFCYSIATCLATIINIDHFFISKI